MLTFATVQATLLSEIYTVHICIAPRKQTRVASERYRRASRDAELVNGTRLAVGA
jgi:hypothetical protein